MSDTKRQRFVSGYLQNECPSLQKMPSPILSILIPALHEGENLRILIPQIYAQLEAMGVSHEVMVVTSAQDQDTANAATEKNAKVIWQTKPGYGGALLAGFEAAKGQYLITMDADFSHPPDFIQTLWAHRDDAELVVASRYVPGGSADMPTSRFVLSKVLNRFFSRGLDLHVKDMSSGFRLYHTGALAQLDLQERDFNVLQESLVKMLVQGYSIDEVPFAYAPRKYGSSHARVFQFGKAYLKTFGKLWALRNSIKSADYDYRAHDSLIPLQRYWQRSRHKHIVELIANEGPVLDVGCGSSKIIGALPEKSLAIDILLKKVRFARRFKRNVVHGSGFTLPVPDESFSCVLCSQVIEHVPMDSPILTELLRALKPGGRLVLGTPDYANWEWVVTEKLYGWFAPGAYADEHISHYTMKSLREYFESRGLITEDHRYILRGELILAFRKPAASPQNHSSQ